jgi:AcrR family transcriptional regulator
MSPRKAAVLRGGGENLRDYLIATAARLIDERGSAGLAVRDIAREAQVADGVLYNYFADKEELLAHALLAHVAAVMSSAPQMPSAGTSTVMENLAFFIDRGLAVLVRVVPAFAGLQAQPKVLSRFHAMVGGDAAFGTEAAGADTTGADTTGAGQPAEGHPGQGAGTGRAGPRGLPEDLSAYLLAEQQLGRINAAADIDAATTLIIGAIHGQILPRVLFSPPGTPVSIPPDLAGRLAATVLGGISPGSRHS